ncbi:ribose ABC transporter [Shimia sp. R10_1]|uniref:RbsD/FucU family protein n=1 Tax=Shimia sp. R10_1 TaxID=2821095 RepID=UPI001ADB58A9|nr:RbsD/FucU domain-containing protein [Shimia sp. R10_1]MBO9475875.1 ribose ABC transporter [Shimia sp. R10_1]
MLRNINPLLSPDLLHTLRAMGHGDEIVIADANFPATSTATSTGPTCIRADGSSASEILEAVLSVMPLDSFVPDPALTMQVVGDPDAVPEAVADFQTIIETTADIPAQIQTLERFAFYDRAARAFAIVQTGERRLYGNIILKKGVIA